MRERGLKFVVVGPVDDGVVESLPVRERGLKLRSLLVSISCFGSLPVRERGLKSEIAYTDSDDNKYVAPRAGAWIEIMPL